MGDRVKVTSFRTTYRPEVDLMRINGRARVLRVAAAAAGLVLLLGACGNDDPSVDSAGGGEASGSFNEADVTFLKDMIPHHEQAIEMAEMVEGRTERPELIELAGNIISSQTAEIEEINTLLEEAGESAEGGAEHDMDSMGSGGSMGMSQEDMDALMEVEGEEFDKMFSEMMIEHHTAAIEMANEVLDGGENAEVATLAEGIIDEQQKEIDDMKSWLQEWGL